MSVILVIIKNMDSASGKHPELSMPTLMKVNMLKTKSADKARFNGRVVTGIKENIRMMSDMVMERCIGLMAVFIKVNGSREFNMALVK